MRSLFSPLNRRAATSGRLGFPPRRSASLMGAAVLLLALSSPALAVNPDEMLKDPVLEHRARVIGEDLRCLVCQNQSIDDSDADLAKDLRIIVRERVAKGDTDDQVKQFLVDRYGDYVLLRPPFKATTLVLWLGPPAVFLAGLWAVLSFFRRRRSTADTPPPPLSAEEQRKLDKLMKEGGA
jgi:cytochrome c-type biogenesis protein CcmH